MTPKGLYELKAVKGREFVELVNMFISGLTERSEYAVALQDHSRQGASCTDFSTLGALNYLGQVMCDDDDDDSYIFIFAFW